MKIIGGKDYYDVGARHGVDPAIVFVRPNECIMMDNVFEADLCPHFCALGRSLFDVEHNLVEFGTEHWEMRPFTVIVAGKRYGGVVADPVRVMGTLTLPEDLRPVLLWSYAGYQDWLVSKGREAMSSDVLASQEQQHLASHFERELDQEDIDWLIANKIVVATIVGFQARQWSSDGGPCWRINGDNLKDFQFYCVVGADQMFQEIASWVGGVLGGPSPDAVEIKDDIVLRDKKGFDEKSFKKGKLVGSKRRRGRGKQAS
jgi:hypothetical protein